MARKSHQDTGAAVYDRSLPEQVEHAKQERRAFPEAEKML